ncbi:MAG: two-component hybrid sensor and regulator, partial [Caldithrix sp.]|nr:two-component hybrid sensor and regulator [Caldithrix sp.]
LNDLKNQFLGMAAHDLRNPLGNIINFIEFIEDNREHLKDEQVEFLNHIRELASFMLKLVNDLLDYSAIESGNIHLKIQSIDLLDIIRKTIWFNQKLAQKKEISVELFTDLPSAPVEVDQGKIEQVLTNLITNAIKFSHAHSHIYVHVNDSEDHIITAVEDEGQGIPENKLNLLFQPFKKIGVKGTGGEKSTGLGLFIVKQIVEAHNGTIKADSVFGEGSTFSIQLPKKPQ